MLLLTPGELNGCFLSDSQSITVNPLPTLSFGSIPELCVNDSLVLNFMSPARGNLFRKQY